MGEQLAGIFERVADTYDAVDVAWFVPIAAGLVEQLQPALGERALDIGCGRGAVLFPLAEAVGPDGHVLGIDLAPAMIAPYRARCRRAPPRWSYVWATPATRSSTPRPSS